MAGEQIVEQAPQITEVMPADPTNNVQAEQPKSEAQMTTEPMRLRGGEEASCECCGCGCSEGCC